MPEVGRGVVIPSATSQTLDIAIAAPSPSVLLADVTLDTLPGSRSGFREPGRRSSSTPTCCLGCIPTQLGSDSLRAIVE